MNKSLKIGQLAKQSGISIEALRYYEAEGLLVPQERSSNGYRLFGADDVHRLNFILHAKKVGFSLQEIKRLLSLRSDRDQHTCEEVKQYTGTKITEIESKITDLLKMKQALDGLYNACCGGNESASNCTILNSLDNPNYFSQSNIIAEEQFSATSHHIKKG